jgi:hypothetical protein
MTTTLESPKKKRKADDPALKVHEHPEEQTEETAEHEPESPPTTKPAASFEEQRLRTIQDLERQVQEAELDLHRAKDVVKERKDIYEAAIATLRTAIRECKEPTPLFDQAAGAKPAIREVDPSDESWREVRLEHALQGCTMHVIGKLQDTQLFTVGDLSNWINADGGRHRLVDIPGVGEGVATKIEEALDAFWERWAERQAKEKADEEAS